MPTDEIPIAALQDNLLRWFDIHKRPLPWRTEPRDPYHVWLAEIMLQQTQVATVIPYYERWLQRFPTLAVLAAAPLDDVLKHWEGLGYYSRARNLHKAAQIVLRDHKGIVPDSVERLMQLPGIGRYTAGAIVSLAYQIDAPILDGNVVRILCRVTAFAENYRSSTAQKALWDLSKRLIPSDRAGQFNEAMMDLGATICTPRAPDCLNCPIQPYCFAYAKGTPDAFPVRAIKTPIPHKDIATAYILDANANVLLAQRPASGLLGGLWEFPSVELILQAGQSAAHAYDAAEHLTAFIYQATGLSLRISANDFVGIVKHAFTHFRITRHVAMLRLDRPAPELKSNTAYTHVRWVSLSEVRDLALTRSDHKTIALVNSQHRN